MIMLIIICQQNLVWRERQNYVLSKKNLAEHKCMGLADLLDTETQSSNFCHFEVIDPFGTILFSSWPKIRFESGSLCSPTAIITEGFGFFLGAFCCCCKSTTSMLCYCKSLPACCVTVNLPACCVTVNPYQHAVWITEGFCCNYKRILLLNPYQHAVWITEGFYCTLLPSYYRWNLLWNPYPAKP